MPRSNTPSMRTITPLIVITIISKTNKISVFKLGSSLGYNIFTPHPPRENGFCFIWPSGATFQTLGLNQGGRHSESKETLHVPVQQHTCDGFSRSSWSAELDSLCPRVTENPFRTEQLTLQECSALMWNHDCFHDFLWNKPMLQTLRHLTPRHGLKGFMLGWTMRGELNPQYICISKPSSQP